MSKEKIESYEVKIRLSEILRRVWAGQSFTITDRGKPVADLLPSKMSVNTCVVKKTSLFQEMLIRD